ncbi:MAG: hypothetical protein H0Z29_10110 [Candidatus Marinimicrobia bacterium]|nr:hypothetical protein [Candidatus Neomarinimicrobiota bacterium]
MMGNNIIFEVEEEYLQKLAKKEFGRKLSEEEIIFIRKGIISALSICLDSIVKTAIQEIEECNS